MRKMILIFLLFISVLGYSQFQIQYADTLNSKPILRTVNYLYPLPVKYLTVTDTTKTILWNGTILTVPFPIKFYK